MNSNQKVIDKIKKLLALAKSPEEHEAALALRKAQQLMKENGITTTDIAAGEIVEITSDVYIQARTIKDWFSVLVWEVAELFQCGAYVLTECKYDMKSGRRKYQSKPVFFGKGVNPELAEYYFTVLYRKLRRARADHMKLFFADKTTYGDSFAIGWVVAVRDKIRPMAPPRPTTAETTGIKGLVPVDAIKAYEANLNARQLDARESQRGNVSSRYGYRAGQKVEVHKPVEKSQASGLIE